MELSSAADALNRSPKLPPRRMKNPAPPMTQTRAAAAQTATVMRNRICLFLRFLSSSFLFSRRMRRSRARCSSS